MQLINDNIKVVSVQHDFSMFYEKALFFFFFDLGKIYLSSLIFQVTLSKVVILHLS